MSRTSSAFRLGFVAGATPDTWARRWRERERGALELVPVAEDAQLDGVRAGEHDVALVRLPVDRTDLHCISLYEEVAVVVAGDEHLVAAADDVTLHDLDEEQLVRPHASGWTPVVDQLAWPAMSEHEAVATVAAGTGVVLLPASVARLHARKDVVTRPVLDLPPTTIALAWLVANDDPRVQRFVGVVRGRTANSSRG